MTSQGIPPVKNPNSPKYDARVDAGKFVNNNRRITAFHPSCVVEDSCSQRVKGLLTLEFTMKNHLIIALLLLGDTDFKLTIQDLWR